MLKVFYSALEPIFKGLEKEGFEKNGFFKKTFFFFSRTDEESVERKASRKEREGRARKGAKTTEGQGKHYGTSQLEQHPYSRGKRESVPQTRLPTRQAQRTKVPRVPHPHVHSVSHGKDARGHVQIRV